MTTPLSTMPLTCCHMDDREFWVKNEAAEEEEREREENDDESEEDREVEAEAEVKGR